MPFAPFVVTSPVSFLPPSFPLTSSRVPSTLRLVRGSEAEVLAMAICTGLEVDLAVLVPLAVVLALMYVESLLGAVASLVLVALALSGVGSLSTLALVRKVWFLGASAKPGTPLYLLGPLDAPEAKASFSVASVVGLMAK